MQCLHLEQGSIHFAKASKSAQSTFPATTNKSLAISQTESSAKDAILTHV